MRRNLLSQYLFHCYVSVSSFARGEGSLHEGCYDDYVVGLDAFAGAVAASYFLASSRLGVAVRCSTMLDVKLEVFIVERRSGDSCGVDLLERGLSWGSECW